MELTPFYKKIDSESYLAKIANQYDTDTLEYSDYAERLRDIEYSSAPRRDTLREIENISKNYVERGGGPHLTFEKLESPKGFNLIKIIFNRPSGGEYVEFHYRNFQFYLLKLPV